MKPNHDELAAALVLVGTEILCASSRQGCSTKAACGVTIDSPRAERLGSDRRRREADPGSPGSSASRHSALVASAISMDQSKINETVKESRALHDGAAEPIQALQNWIDKLAASGWPKAETMIVRKTDLRMLSAIYGVDDTEGQEQAGY